MPDRKREIKYPRNYNALIRSIIVLSLQDIVKKKKFGVWRRHKKLKIAKWHHRCWRINALKFVDSRLFSELCESVNLDGRIIRYKIKKLTRPT